MARDKLVHIQCPVALVKCLTHYVRYSLSILYTYVMSELSPEEHRIKISPCVANCCLDLQDVCMGCFRTLQEILDWHSADEQQRREILQRCDKRRQDKQ